MNYMTEKLKYTSTVTNLVIFDTGLCKYENIDEIYKTVIKDKVILKINLLNDALRDYFEPETIVEYRDILILLVQGIIPEDKLADILMLLIRTDKKFRSVINCIFNRCDPNDSFGHYIITELSEQVVRYYGNIRLSLVGRKPMIICESDCWLYLSIPDEEDFVFDNYAYEVVSYAKNWKGSSAR